MKNYIQAGANLSVIATAAAAAGAGVKEGSLFGIAQADVEAAGSVTIVRKGVFSVAKVSAQAWTIGAKIYWDDTAKLFTTVSTSNTLVGAATAVAANPSSTGDVLLTGQIA